MVRKWLMPDKFKKKPVVLAQKKKPSVNDMDRKGNFKISLQYFDSSQKYSSSFKDWQKAGLLSKALETLRGYCSSSLLSQANTNKFTVYGAFPSKENTMFEYPANVPDDACWARIHVNGSAVIIGHIVNDTFYIVFLDKTHKFWMTKKTKGK